MNMLPFKNLDILKLWNEVIIIEQEYKINREVFWAASKVEVLAKQNEEVILMDHDTLVFKPIKKYLGNKVTVTNLEN